MANVERVIFDLESVKVGIASASDVIYDADEAIEIIEKAQALLREQEKKLEKKDGEQDG